MSPRLFRGMEPGVEPEADRWFASTQLAADLDAHEALIAGLPVPRRRLRMEALEAIGEEIVGADFVLTDDHARRLKAVYPLERDGPQPEEPPAAEEPAEPFRIDVYSAKELCELELPQDHPELVGPFLRRGRITLLGGPTGHGKTTFGSQMLAAGVLGRAFLEWDVAGGLRVLVIDLEQHLEDIQEQLAAVGLAGSELVDYAPIPEGLQIDRDPAQLGELERIVAAKPYDVVRADPFYKLHAANSSDEEQARALVRLTRRWVNEHGFALLMDTHTRKRLEGLTSFTVDELFGSSLFARDPEVVLGLQLLSDGFSRLHILKARGRRGEIRTGQTIDLVYSDDELFRRKPEEDERDLRAELLELGSDQVWRTLKEWKTKPGKTDADRSAPDYVKRRGGIGASQDAVRDKLGELLAEGLFDYAEGADAGRASGAKCWRLKGDPDAQVTPGHPGQSGAKRGSDEVTDPLPSLSVGEAAVVRSPGPSGDLDAQVTADDEDADTWANRIRELGLDDDAGDAGREEGFNS